MAVATPCWPAPVSAMIRRLPIRVRQQRLAEGVVDLVRAGVVEVLALEVDRCCRRPRTGAAPGRAARGGRRSRAGGRTARPGSRDRRAPRSTPPRARPAPASASPARTGPRRGRSGARRALIRSPPSPTPFTAAANASSLAGDLRPGLDSTPLATSTANGLDRRDRARDVGRVEPAGQDHRDRPTVRPRDLPGERLARSARDAGHVAVEQVIVGVEGRQRLDVGAAADPRRLDHLAAGAPRRLGAVRPGPRRRGAGASSARPRRRSAATCSSVGVDEHADDLGAAAQRGRDLGRVVELAPARRVRPEDQPDRPRAGLDRELRRPGAW